MGLQSVLGWWITKCGNSDYKVCLVLDYKVCLVLDYKVWQNELQSVLWIKKCGRMDQKVLQGFQSVRGLKSE